MQLLPQGKYWLYDHNSQKERMPFIFLFFVIKLLIKSLRYQNKLYVGGWSTGIEVHFQNHTSTGYLSVFISYALISQCACFCATLERLHLEITEHFFFKRNGITLASRPTSPLSIKNRSAVLKGLSKLLQANNSCCHFVTGENFTHCSTMTPVKSVMLHQCRKKFVPVFLKCPTHVSVKAGGWPGYLCWFWLG